MIQKVLSKGWGGSSGGEGLPSMAKALGLNSSISTRERKKERRMGRREGRKEGERKDLEQVKPKFGHANIWQPCVLEVWVLPQGF
jgi:hypothetical protein